MNNEKIKELCDKFSVKGEFRSFKKIENGHINQTYVVYYLRDGEIKDYILQRVNTYVFKEPVSMMENISNVTEYIRAKIKAEGVSAKRLVLHFSTATDGKYYYEDESGFWRCSRYIDDSVTFNSTENLKVIEETGKAFGEFQTYLADYPVKELHIAIPHFHNTVMRYRTFYSSVEKDQSGRRASVEKEIAEYSALEDTACEMYKMQRAGKLPLKVTHNDTKCNNVLFDKDTFEHLAVLDLDTVMPGLIGFDFGDAIRFIANTAEEDEKDLEKAGLDFDKYEAFVKGFVPVVGDTLTDYEKDTLALGAITMTIECGLRFLTDYIDGDKYFGISYPDHNLDRARCQLALAKDMIKKYGEMKNIVEKYLKCNISHQ